jgi:O-methyltransferase
VFTRIAKKIISRFGYRVIRLNSLSGSMPDQIPAYDQDGLFTQHCASFMRDDYFLRAYAAGEATGSWNGAAVHWRVHIACWLAERASHLEGDLIECGVNRGGMARAIVAYLDGLLKDKHFYLLDTYEGLPVSLLSEHESRHQDVFKEVYTECLQEVMNTFSPFPEVVIVKGLVPDTFYKVASNKFCFVHIDMNNAQSEIAAAEYLWPRLATGGFMLLDDYGWQINIDQRNAFNQFAQEHGLKVLALPTGQGLLMKV